MKKTLLALWLIGVLSIGATAQDAVLSALTDIKTDIAGIKTDIAGMKTDIAVMKTDITGIKTDIAVMKTDIAVMKTDIAGMKTDVAVINTRLEGLDVDVQSIFDIWVPLFLVAVGTIALVVITALWSVIVNKKQKEPNAIRSSSDPELAGLRPKQRAKARPAT